MMNPHDIRRKHRPRSRCGCLSVANKQLDKDLPDRVNLMTESEASTIYTGIGHALFRIGCIAIRVASPWVVSHFPATSAFSCARVQLDDLLALFEARAALSGSRRSLALSLSLRLSRSGSFAQALSQSHARTRTCVPKHAHVCARECMVCVSGSVLLVIGEDVLSLACGVGVRGESEMLLHRFENL